MSNNINDERKEVLEELEEFLAGSIDVASDNLRPLRKGEYAVIFYRDYRLLKIIAQGGDDFIVVKNGNSFHCIKDNLQKVVIKAMDEIDKDE